MTAGSHSARTDSRATPPGTTVLAFDFGEKRIGVAVGDTTVGIAHPLTVIAAEDNATRFDVIATLIAEWRPARLVVGEPAYADGSEHPVGRLARRFAHRLEGRFGIAVTLVDERLTSSAAAAGLIEAGTASRRRRQIIDAVAAQEILRTYLESARGDAKPA